MFEIGDEKFEKTRKEAEEFYKSIKEVWCPYFQEMIVFNAKGIEHIKFHDIRKARSRQDQYVRLKLIPLAQKIIQKSHTLQGFSIRNSFEREKTHSRWENVMRSATYYEFIAIIKDVRIRVIVKQIDDGPKYFWSIIPFGKWIKYREKD